MKGIVLVIIGILISTSIFSQARGVIYESHIDNQKKDYRSLAYKRTLATSTDKEYGHYYNTQYEVYDKKGDPVITINIVNYKQKGIIEIYIYPYYNWQRQDDLLRTYIIDPIKFKELVYDQKSNNNTKKAVSLKYLSYRKEHILLNQIDSKLFNLHYAI